MTDVPRAFQDVLNDFADLDRSERAELLIEFADEFNEVPGSIAKRPFAEENHVQRCESEAYVFPEELPDGTLKFHFAVENPQGLSAKAWSVILDETLSGKPLEEVAAVSPEAVLTVFGKDLSMGKGQGLMGITDMVTHAAKRRLAARQTT
ncbi:MAG: SufE family protein [Anaerolineaceae bacterium]